MIICAAIKLVNDCDNVGLQLENPRELIVCGFRHGDCFKTIAQLQDSWLENTKKIQGFITHKGEFLTRQDAFEHAKEIGQCNATQRWYWEDHNQDELYSEDLY